MWNFASAYRQHIYCNYFLVCFSFFLLTSGLSAQAKKTSDPKPVYPKTQASIIKENFRQEIHADARRRLLYYRELMADGQALRARSYLENFLKVYPDFQDDFEIRKLLADSLKASGQSRLSAEAYVEAYSSAPEEERGLRAYLSAARLFADLGEKTRARKILKEILRRRPSSGISRIAERELASFPLSDSISEERERDRTGGSENEIRKPNRGQGQSRDERENDRRAAELPLISDEADADSVGNKADNRAANTPSSESDAPGKANSSDLRPKNTENTKTNKSDKNGDTKEGDAAPSAQKEEGFKKNSKSKKAGQNSRKQSSGAAQKSLHLGREDLVGEGIE